MREVIDGSRTRRPGLWSPGDGYGLTFTQHGEPLLHRFRGLDPAMGEEAAGHLVLRDLKLTQTFLGEHCRARTGPGLC